MITCDEATYWLGANTLMMSVSACMFQREGH